MGQHLVLTIRLHDSRYHGGPEWPPAPARAFQALVAGVARGATVRADARGGLEWLESLAAPTVAAPRQRRGQPLELYVPNNDADSLGGDLTRIGEIKTKKLVAPQLLEGSDAFVYAWPVDTARAGLSQIEVAANELYQFGRGVDMAWAVAELLEDADVEARLAAHGGTVHRPAAGDRGDELACPAPGSLDSLAVRYAATAHRLRAEDGRMLFVQPPKARFVQVRYDAAPTRVVYELLDPGEGDVRQWSITRAVALVERVRDGAAERLRTALPAQTAIVDRLLIGRGPDGASAGSPSERVRIVPLPSIGHEHADRSIRRMLVEIPPGCPLAVNDVQWAFAGLDLVDPDTGEVEPFVLAPTDDLRMLEHYRRASRVWRTVTPAALPEGSSRRRIEPTRQREEAKAATERLAEEGRARAAVATALRHAGVDGEVATLRVQREPFEGQGTRVERFAPGTRFAKERLWHVEVTFHAATQGPLVIGDGRFLGLGVMAPERLDDGVFAWRIEAGLLPAATSADLAHALRRAVMARVQVELGRKPMPAFFSGHGEDGGAARSEHAPHLACHHDGHDRLLVIAPHVFERRDATAAERSTLATLARALAGLTELRAGPAGLLTLRRDGVDPDTDPLLVSAPGWMSVNPYEVNRHRRPLVEDVQAECIQRGLPRPVVEVVSPGRLILAFPVAVPGPLLLGRARYRGGGLFAALRG